jgi:ferredoxin-NADP reductase
MGIRVRAKKPVQFEGGQFVAVKVPNGPKKLYSFASPPSGLLNSNEFELCVKYLPGGAGSEYLAGLKPGDSMEVWGPYGDFVYESDPSRSVCFIATGTGIAPMRSIVLSEQFQINPPLSATLLFGARDHSDILYPAVFEKAGCDVIYALSQASAKVLPIGAPQTTSQIFKGRITACLESLPKHTDFRTTDFYLCGNNEMIADVTAILTQAFGVSPQAIHAEAFGSTLATPSLISPFKPLKKVA